MALNASNLPCLVSGKRSGLFCRKYDAFEFRDRFSDFLVLSIFLCLIFPSRERARRKALCDFASDPARRLRPRSKIAPHCDQAVEAPHARQQMRGHLIYWHCRRFVHANGARRLRRRRKADYIIRVISRWAADVRVGPESPTHGPCCAVTCAAHNGERSVNASESRFCNRRRSPSKTQQ